jgi:methylated-DNA-[protein]-cysteine S-methyltransferase
MDSPVGKIVLVSNDTHLKSLAFSDERVEVQDDLPGILQMTIRQLNEYFAGIRFSFELDLDPDGTGFQKKVWQQLLQVPFGATKNYRDIAILTGSALNARAVGTANGKNPIPVIIPCHRIIGSDGKLTGYSGGLDRKRWLLLHEARHTKNETLF